MLVLRYVKRIEVEFLQIQAVPGRLVLSITGRPGRSGTTCPSLKTDTRFEVKSPR